MYVPGALLLGKDSYQVPVELEAGLSRRAGLDVRENKKYQPLPQWIPVASVFQTVV
jgi:hypothetical protein